MVVGLYPGKGTEVGRTCLPGDEGRLEGGEGREEMTVTGGKGEDFMRGFNGSGGGIARMRQESVLRYIVFCCAVLYLVEEGG